MKLQKKVVPCNKKKTNAAPKFEIANSNSNVSQSTVVTAMLYDAIGKQTTTDIAADNVLILGQNLEWNQEAAIILQSAFAKANRLARIIDVVKFLSMPIDARRDDSIFYIIICSDVDISTKKLSELKAHTGTQILFKIAGLHIKRTIFGVSVSKSAKAILESLDIREDNAISIRLLASLGVREFCVIGVRNICKRVL